LHSKSKDACNHNRKCSEHGDDEERRLAKFRWLAILNKSVLSMFESFLDRQRP
jgi:hypothetical protein